MQMIKKIIIGSTQQLIENVEVSFIVILMNNSRLFKQIIQNIAAIWYTLPVKISLKLKFL